MSYYGVLIFLNEFKTCEPVCLFTYLFQTFTLYAVLKKTFLDCLGGSTPIEGITFFLQL